MEFNIDQLTIGQAKELVSFFGSDNETQEDLLYKSSIGKYVIIRSRNEGINCGKLVYANKNGCIIEDARRLYFHKPKDNNVSWYEGVAMTGLHSDSKISGETTQKVIVEDYSITICTDESEKSLRNAVAQGS